jgi:hypothetical protein
LKGKDMSAHTQFALALAGTVLACEPAAAQELPENTSPEAEVLNDIARMASECAALSEEHGFLGCFARSGLQNLSPEARQEVVEGFAAGLFTAECDGPFITGVISIDPAGTDIDVVCE